MKHVVRNPSINYRWAHTNLAILTVAFDESCTRLYRSRDMHEIQRQLVPAVDRLQERLDHSCHRNAQSNANKRYVRLAKRGCIFSAWNLAGSSSIQLHVASVFYDSLSEYVSWL